MIHSPNNQNSREGNNQNNQPARNTQAKTMHLNMDEWITHFRLAFTNGQLPEILPVVQIVEYTVEMLQGYLAKTDELE